VPRPHRYKPQYRETGFTAALSALILGAVAMGASPIFVRLVSNEVGPFASAFWRMALALPFLAIWLQWEARRRPDRSEKKFTLYSCLAGLAFTGDLVFWHLAILNTSIANATFFATLMPVFVIIITWLILKLPVHRASLAGILVCLVGGAILVGMTLQVNPKNLKGDLYGLTTAFFFSLYFLAVSQARRNGAGTASLTFSQTTVTTAALLVIALVHSVFTKTGFLPSSGKAVAALLGLALVSQVGGQGLMTLSLGRLPTVFSSLVIFMEAIAAALLGWVILGEALTFAQLVGGLLILIGIAIARPK
jgi:drug/metabolite transporter (DMT)-like permease